MGRQTEEANGADARRPDLGRVSFADDTAVARVRNRANKNPASRRGFHCPGLTQSSGGYLHLVFRWLAQHVAAAPNRLNVVLAARSVGELLAQLADEDVDDLQLGLVHAAVEMIEEHLLGQRRALAQAQELQHLVLLAGQMHPRGADL